MNTQNTHLYAALTVAISSSLFSALAWASDSCTGERYREHLRAAGITRPVLFEKSKARQPIRLHDTRATFITIALANGKSEAWVQDRTGHRSRRP